MNEIPIQVPIPIPPSPCLKCGACCAAFKVCIQESEIDNIDGGYIPEGMTIKVSALSMVMKGTDRKSPRCVALSGGIGVNAKCSIYEKRPNVCRNFIMSCENGMPNDMCDRARARYGLIAFSAW